MTLKLRISLSRTTNDCLFLLGWKEGAGVNFPVSRWIHNRGPSPPKNTVLVFHRAYKSSEQNITIPSISPFFYVFNMLLKSFNNLLIISIKFTPKCHKTFLKSFQLKNNSASFHKLTVIFLTTSILDIFLKCSSNFYFQFSKL